MKRLVLVLALARAASADPIAVHVIEVAGGTAYVAPGRVAGLVAGSKIRFGTSELVVVDSTAETAAVALGGLALAVGDVGSADVAPPAPSGGKLAPPRPLAAFRDQWPAGQPPATGQQPSPVPLGASRESRRARLVVTGHAYGAVDRSGGDGQLEAGVASSFDVLRDRPLGADLDGSVRVFGNGWNRAERTPVFVRAAQLRWGDPNDPALSIGRLRYAASSLGMLDGGRAALHTGDLELAAFGGIVPHPISGKPDTSATRFGGELVYTGAWSRLAIAAHGSTWQRQLDERRLSIVASAHRGATWLDGWLEAQEFGSGNPWGAPALDLTGAGATGEWRRGGAHLGLDVTFLRPDRSLRLASLLPPDWLCARTPLPGSVAEPCQGGDYWTAATASAGERGATWSVDAVGSLGETRSVTRGYDASGYVRGELGRTTRLIVAPSVGRTTFASWLATDVGVAVSPARSLDASLIYRPERLDYPSASGAYFMQSLVADLHAALSPVLAWSVSAIATTGADRDVIALLATMVWRPLP